MEVSESTVQNIQKFANDRAAVEKESTEEPLSATALHVYTRRLDSTLRELQEQVRLQEEELKKLRERRSFDLLDADNDPWARVCNARRARKAYESLLKAEEDLPGTDSVLPSLMAIEETSRLIKDGKKAISTTAESLSKDRDRLNLEEANLRDSRAISSGLQERLQRIRNANAQRQEQTPSEVAAQTIRDQRRKKKQLDRALGEIKGSLDSFIDETLAPMLAAEDLGGPTVGDALEISDATLNAGYTAHGKPKKPKQSSEAEDGQQRIDLFLRQSGGAKNKREAAATEIHELLDSLLEAGNSYVALERDSAVSRFLVRAKVAQFHPRDARRLRLIDFGRSLVV
ncbi:hypothetical protein N7468_007059 [Penicillium chermesinum]|uniref:Uncharacterized protein n=1 Tax=Penicillium chermesinum TaxID=63820 RepID=A0A9W9NWA6_9EURO|nr:uncharacterized protein N7468_007059 [Penicillium chermesinum]KAJ5225834.1 hypothetical protein N7468_007059 [Penicillium chermesinum]